MGSLSDLLWGRAYCAVSDIQLFCFFCYHLSVVCFLLTCTFVRLIKRVAFFCLCRESIAHIVSCPN